MIGIKMFLRKNVSKVVVVLMISSFLACKKDNGINSEILKIPIELRVSRFDQMLSKANSSDLPELKLAFPFLFNTKVPDSVWLNKINDPLQQELYSEVDKKFNDFSEPQRQIEDFYRHMVYYYPDFETPEIVTLVNEVDYRNKTIATDTLVLIALDNYLGADHRFYQNIAQYISANMKEDQIVCDLAQAYARQMVQQKPPRSLLDEMIYQGKQLYFKDIMIPFKPDAEKIGYSEEQLKWANDNESSIWSYFIDKELLYSTDTKLNGRFINPAPYSKFYLELDNESPGRIGVYIGWQIVRAYAKNTEADLATLMRMPADELFKKSKFKPNK
uniref:gliding motility lipoprotein GldB n=1 Tax=Winogradskyella aurantiaca TaxID=2219558 RepID=UPI000E1E0131|nr:gliding motility lipoprotein GldB [Winogradskyella aurantiaca]